MPTNVSNLLQNLDHFADIIIILFAYNRTQLVAMKR